MDFPPDSAGGDVWDFGLMLYCCDLVCTLKDSVNQEIEIKAGNSSVDYNTMIEKENTDPVV